MGYNSFNLADDSSVKYQKKSRTSLILALVVGVCVGFTCGILIGHYGIDKSEDSNSNPTADQIVGNTVVTTTITVPADTSVTSQAETAASIVTDTEMTTAAEQTTTTTEAMTSTLEAMNSTTESMTSTTETMTSTTITPDPNDLTSMGPDSGETTTINAPVDDCVCIPEAIIREEDPDITDLIFQELNATNIEENLKFLVEQPHVAGTEADFKQANDLKQFWLDNGLDVAVTTPYDILLSYPDSNKSSNVRVLNGSEVIVESPDYETNLTAEERPWDWPFPYLGYSGNGTVRGSIVYVNYGQKEDYDTLESLNISVNGTIVLARYGNGFRGEKVKLAEDRGVLAVILYADPGDYVAPWASDAYPDSIWIPATAVSRGTIFMGTGDPLTPGYPAIESAYRYDENDPETNLPKIPALPIGYEIAEKLLQLIGGPEAPEGWTGRLNATYRLGPGFTDEELMAEVNVNTYNERRTSYNAFGMIRGESEPDRYVMLGNHRDSWVLGSIDPSSGTATMMELSRVLGQLVKEGRWRPRRSIIFCSWGAEEFGLIGSTEWIEENSKVLDSRSVAYINMDIAVTGNYSLRGRGSPPVFTAMYNAAKKIQTPNDSTNKTLFETWTERKPLRDPEDGAMLGLPVITTPGEGSDYGTFQIRAGITCADFRYDQDFAGDNVLFYPLYHTGYETFYAVQKLIDPGFVLHSTIGKLSGELLRDLADSKILPFNMSDYTLFLRHYAYALTSNASDVMLKHGLNTAELGRVIDLYDTEAVNFHAMVDSIDQDNPLEVRRVNDQMMQIERAFLDPTGLPGRDSLYRHLVHSTSLHSPFPGDSFPGMKDAIFKVREEPENPDFIRELQQHFSVLVFTIQGAAYSLKNSTEFMRENIV